MSFTPHPVLKGLAFPFHIERAERHGVDRVLAATRALHRLEDQWEHNGHGWGPGGEDDCYSCSVKALVALDAAHPQDAEFVVAHGETGSVRTRRAAHPQDEPGAICENCGRTAGQHYNRFTGECSCKVAAIYAPANPQDGNPQGWCAMNAGPLPDCARCGHPSDWHRLNDALNIGPCDPSARFRCIGYDCESAGPIPEDRCACPDYSGWRAHPQDGNP